MKMRPVHTKYELSCQTISFSSYHQTCILQSADFKQIYHLLGQLLCLRSKTLYFIGKFTFFPLIFDMFDEL